MVATKITTIHNTKSESTSYNKDHNLLWKCPGSVWTTQRSSVSDSDTYWIRTYSLAFRIRICIRKTDSDQGCVNIKKCKHFQRKIVAEPKLFIFGSGSDFHHNFGSGSGSSSCYSHILAL